MIHPRGLHYAATQLATCSWAHSFMANKVPCKEGLVVQVSGEACAMLWKKLKAEAKDIEAHIQWLSLMISGL